MTMHILLTNDDGFAAPGLTALYRAIGPAHRVIVVAPDGERSTCGHAATLDVGLRVHRRHHTIMGDVFAVEGTPVDCVRLAIAELITGTVDCVLSGMNRGANVSVVDVSQSGTVAAAREAAFCGIRGIAVSQMFHKSAEIDWGRSTQTAATLLPQLFNAAAPAGCFWNVNLPALEPEARPRCVRVVPLSREPVPLVFEPDEKTEPAQRGGEIAVGDHRAYRYAGFYETRRFAPNTDVAAVFGGDVAITPIEIDATHDQARATAPTFHL